MCQVPNCQNEATIAVVDLTEQGRMVGHIACDGCSANMVEASDTADCIKIGVFAAVQELCLDDYTVVETEAVTSGLTLADIIADLVANPVS